MVSAALDDSATGAHRVEALLMLAMMDYWTEGSPSAAKWCEQALEESGDDRRLLARCHAALADLAPFEAPRLLEHARRAVELLGEDDDPPADLLANTLKNVAYHELRLGQGLSLSTLEHAVAIEASCEPLPVLERVGMYIGMLSRFAGEFDEARTWLLAMLQCAHDEGDDSALPTIYGHLALLECWAGNYPLAMTYVASGNEFTILTGVASPSVTAAHAFALSAIGNIDEARQVATAAIADDEAQHDDGDVACDLRSLGFAELAAGNLLAAADHLLRALTIVDELGVLEPSILRIHADAVEALVGLGRLAEAEGLTAELERSDHAHSLWATTMALRCRGLLSLAAGDLAGAEAALTASLSGHAAISMPFEEARTYHWLGVVRRRAGQRRNARQPSMAHCAYSNRSAPRCSPSELAPSWLASAAGPQTRMRSHRPKRRSPNSSARARRTPKSPRRCTSTYELLKVTSRASTASLACAPAPSSPAFHCQARHDSRDTVDPPGGIASVQKLPSTIVARSTMAALDACGSPMTLTSDGDVTAKLRSPLATKTMSSVEFQKASSPSPSTWSELDSSCVYSAASARLAKVCRARITLGSAFAAYSQMAAPAPPATFIGFFIAVVTSASLRSWQAEASVLDPLPTSELVWLASTVAAAVARGLVALLLVVPPPPHPPAMTASTTAPTTARARPDRACQYHHCPGPRQPAHESATLMLELEDNLMQSTVITSRQLGIRGSTQLCWRPGAPRLGVDTATAHDDLGDADSCAIGAGEHRVRGGGEGGQDEAVPRLDTTDAHDPGCHVGGSDGHRADTTVRPRLSTIRPMGSRPSSCFPRGISPGSQVTVHNQHVDPNCPSTGTFEDLVNFDPGPTFSQVCRDELLTLRYDAHSHKPMPRRFSEQRGVKVTIADYGLTSSAPAYEPMYQALEAAGYTRDRNIRVAGYDARLTPDMGGFLQRSKHLIEETYRQNGEPSGASRRPFQRSHLRAVPADAHEPGVEGQVHPRLHAVGGELPRARTRLCADVRRREHPRPSVPSHRGERCQQCADVLVASLDIHHRIGPEDLRRRRDRHP